MRKINEIGEKELKITDEKLIQECVRCGMCCMLYPCMAGRTTKNKQCMLIEWDGDKAVCHVVDIISKEYLEIGKGCRTQLMVKAMGELTAFCLLPGSVRLQLAKTVHDGSAPPGMSIGFEMMKPKEDNV